MVFRTPTAVLQSSVLGYQRPFGNLQASAVISACGAYRYTLSREWEEWKQPWHMLFICLNPSTADHMEQDPTLRRCMGFAHALGYQGVRIVNLCAFRATKPEKLDTVADPVGPENLRYVQETLADPRVREVICAWGASVYAKRHMQPMIDLLRSKSVPLKALKVTSTGLPQHPLYLSNRCTPRLWEPRIEAKKARRQAARQVPEHAPPRPPGFNPFAQRSAEELGSNVPVPEYRRVSHQSLCAACGREYIHHPQHFFGMLPLHQTCDGSWWKL